jgi:DNA recombination protein RmuC
MEYIYLITGILLGILIAGLYFRMKKPVSDEYSKEQLLEYKSDIRVKDEELLKLNRELAMRETELKNLNSKLAEQQEEIRKLYEKFSTEFKNLANEILDEKSKKFTEQNKTNLDEILKPLNERIKDFEKKVQEVYDKEAQQRFSLKEEVKRLAELNQQIGKEANALTQALKGESKTRGSWGEVILESILEKSGLRKNEEYFIQQSFTADEGKRLQPDVIVHYPGERSIIIDSKVSLNAYEKYVSASDDEEKQAAVKQHVRSIENHINDLATKNYQDIENVKTLDFVVMFMPVEPAYLLAIQNKPELWNIAYEKRILLISPTNLIAVLKMIESLWKQEYQNKNVMEIARQGGELYDKFVGLVDDLIDVGHKLKQTQKSYESSMNKLSTGKGNLVKRAQNLKELGVKTKKTLPGNLLDRAVEE